MAMQRDPAQTAPDAGDIAPMLSSNQYPVAHRQRSLPHTNNQAIATRPGSLSTGLEACMEASVPGRLIVPSTTKTIPNVSSQGGLHFQPHLFPPSCGLSPQLQQSYDSLS